MTTALDQVLARIDADLDASLERLFEMVRIPSISTDPAHKADCRRTAEWLAAELNGLGFNATVRDTTGHPMVVAHDPKGQGKPGPHALFYGHYDVQPVDPLHLWNDDPFDPKLVPQPDGETWITGRGASDDKGALMTFVEACRAWKAVNGGLPINVSMLFEGEEESGSPSLKPFLEANKAELSLDVALVCDTDMWDRETPAITTMLRGLVGEEIIITAASRDLHSGMFGNAARNPIHLLTAILAGLRDADGRVTVPGFYDGVKELAPAVKAQWDRLPFDQAAVSGAMSASPFPPARRAARCWSRSGRARPARSTASSAATPARASRRSFRPRPRPRCRSASSRGRTPRKFAPPSAPMCAP